MIEAAFVVVAVAVAAAVKNESPAAGKDSGGNNKEGGGCSNSNGGTNKLDTPVKQRHAVRAATDRQRCFIFYTVLFVCNPFEREGENHQCDREKGETAQKPKRWLTGIFFVALAFVSNGRRTDRVYTKI